MAQTHTQDEVTERVPGLALRFVLAALAILGYLLVREDLDPAPLVAARFGLGITLFALLVDVGRAFAGASPPVSGGFRPHQQRGEPLVDEGYRDVHRSMRAYLDRGVFTDHYEELIREAMEARGVAPAQVDHAVGQAQDQAGGTTHAHRPYYVQLASGLVAVVGGATAIGVLLESLDVPLLWPLLALVGLGTYLLQTRILQTGSKAATGAVGLLGALLVFLGGTGLVELHGSGFRIVQGTGVVLALGTVALLWLGTFQRPAWREVKHSLQQELATLRRAFLVTLLGGLVLFPFKPLLGALFEALGWSLDVPYRMAVIGYATVATFLALELAGTWYALNQGEREEREARRARVEANQALLDLLEAKGPQTRNTGRRA